MSKSGPLLAVGLLLPAVVFAQGAKISGTVVCTPPSALHALPVEGRPAHSYAVSQVKCTWTKPWTIAGVASKEGVGTGTDTIAGNTSIAAGTYVDTMANGDTAIYKYGFNAITKDGKPEKISNHHWELIGGSGKFAAVTGKGTCNVTVQADDKIVYECQGSYK